MALYFTLCCIRIAKMQTLYYYYNKHLIVFLFWSFKMNVIKNNIKLLLKFLNFSVLCNCLYYSCSIVFLFAFWSITHCPVQADHFACWPFTHLMMVPCTHNKDPATIFGPNTNNRVVVTKILFGILPIP